jgi:hypothetical protein
MLRVDFKLKVLDKACEEEEEVGCREALGGTDPKESKYNVRPVFGNHMPFHFR